MDAGKPADLGREYLRHAAPVPPVACPRAAGGYPEVPVDRSRLQPGTQRSPGTVRWNDLFDVAGKSNRPERYRPGKSIWQCKIQLRLRVLLPGPDPGHF